MLQTRDGKLRAAIPSPLGQCVFLNDVEQEEMAAALREHKKVMKSYPREGAGLEACVDSSDTGYTSNAKPAENGVKAKNLATKSVINDDVVDGLAPGGLGQNGNVDGKTGNKEHAVNHASGPEGVDGLANGSNGLSNGKANGVH